MSTGQSLLTLFGIMMLSMLALRLNSTLLITQDTMQNSKFGLLAVSLATSYLEEANRKAFDEITLAQEITTVTQLTAVNALGPEIGEVYPDFDDFDDFNNLIRVDDTMPSAIFNIRANVVYTTTANPNSTSATRTYHKRINLTISSPSMTDTLRFSTVYSYWAFR
ncbi:MAG: hypothetical protein C0425_06175 [Chlorobiaceae bacterium]|nr:hypothetical protein [Chlorobiaceae bacterium]MBA4309906.1 hypothetical protein [Chlorobiaceae bacterium]